MLYLKLNMLKQSRAAGQHSFKSANLCLTLWLSSATCLVLCAGLWCIFLLPFTVAEPDAWCECTFNFFSYAYSLLCLSSGSLGVRVRPFSCSLVPPNYILSCSVYFIVASRIHESESARNKKIKKLALQTHGNFFLQNLQFESEENTEACESARSASHALLYVSCTFRRWLGLAYKLRHTWRGPFSTKIYPPPPTPFVTLDTSRGWSRQAPLFNYMDRVKFEIYASPHKWRSSCRSPLKGSFVCDTVLGVFLTSAVFPCTVSIELPNLVLFWWFLSARNDACEIFFTLRDVFTCSSHGLGRFSCCTSQLSPEIDQCASASCQADKKHRANCA